MKDKNAHIPTETIKEDIIDTQREIIRFELEAKGFRLIGDRLSLMKADSRDSGIQDRKLFIEKLEKILEIRKTQTVQEEDLK